MILYELCDHNDFIKQRDVITQRRIVGNHMIRDWLSCQK